MRQITTPLAHETRTSPVRRGKWLLEHLFGIPPPAPPSGLLPLKEDPVGAPTSVRKRMEEHTSRNAACVICHAMFVPLGFAFDNFDAIGRWRVAEGTTMVDASGTFPDGTFFNGPVEFRTGVMQHRDAFVRTLTERLFAYAMGREIERYDMPAIRLIVTQAASEGDRWSSLILGIVKSEPFQSKRVMP